MNALPSILLQNPTPAPSDEALAAVGLLVFLVIVQTVFILIIVSIWLRRDCKRRGENPTLWVTLFVILYLMPLFMVGGAILLLIYVAVRNRQPLYDVQGNAMLPTAPPSAPMPLGGPAPPLDSGAARPSKVRCPRCRTVFEYRKNPLGRSQVKCPSCGEEGTI